MNPDEYQLAWQAETARNRVTIDAELLSNEVQRRHGDFRTMIFWRDCREIGVAVLLIPVWFYLGYVVSPPWTWYLTAPALVWVIAFMLIDRRRHPLKRCKPDASIFQCVQESLKQVEHQIWLLRNVAWRYLLPFTVSIMAFFIHVAWKNAASWREFLCVASALGSLLAAVYGLVWWVNQLAVRLQLEPRRRELLLLLSSLQDESVHETSNEPVRLPALPFSNDSLGATGSSSDSSAMSAVIVILMAAAILVGVIVFVDNEVKNRGATTQQPIPAQTISVSSFAEAAARGHGAFLQRDFDGAITAWDEAIRLNPDHSEAYRWRGDAWLNKRMPDKALFDYDEAIRLDPKNGMAFSSRSVAWFEKGDFDQALADLDAAVELDPNIAETPFYNRYRNRAESLSREQQLTSEKSE
jgi:tetratricopeptide (TPR) repeat protein